MVWKEEARKSKRWGLERKRNWKKREFKDFWGSIEGGDLGVMVGVEKFLVVVRSCGR